jgi:uncharacterized protein YbjT (DUF2867 family)
MASVFITGATGYMARALVPRLVARGHRVRGLARKGSEAKLGAGCEPVSGDPLDSSTWRDSLTGCDTLVHLVGVPRPSPAKAAQFRAVDLVSIREAVAAARPAAIAHFVYLSVAHPAPVMRAYIEVRTAGEAAIWEAGLNATILRPWYVLGPGHRWPVLLVPVYWAMERIPATRDAARRLGLVTLPQMTAALVAAVENPARGTRIVEVPEIRRYGTR